jgi:hypothetical protein
MSISNWLLAHELPCFYKKFSGMDCPGCGMQRSFIHLINGDIAASFKMYPALLPLLFTLLFLSLHLIFKYKHGARVIVYAYSFTAAIIVVSYVVKIFNGVL